MGKLLHLIIDSEQQLLPLFNVPNNTSITKVKERVFQETGIHPQDQVLLLNGIEQPNTRLLYDLKETDFLTVSKRGNKPATHPPSPSASVAPLPPQIAFSPQEVEMQRRELEYIRLKNVEENYEQALEHNPETFAPVTMLYIPCEVNGKYFRAFVDTGAQKSIMSIQCAERCGLLRLVDRRFAGIAKGVGAARIIGQVHLATLKIGHLFLDFGFSIIDQPDMDFIVGLDLLRKFQASIDLANNQLVIANEKVPFLAEKDLFEDFDERILFTDRDKFNKL
jgi:hypothetical protein